MAGEVLEAVPWVFGPELGVELLGVLPGELVKLGLEVLGFEQDLAFGVAVDWW